MGLLFSFDVGRCWMEPIASLLFYLVIKMEVVVWNIFTKNHVQQQENYLTIKNAQKGSDIIYNIVFLKNTQFSISLPPPTPHPSHTFFKEEE